MYKKILVPIDINGKNLFNQVMPHIEYLARKDDVEVHFLAVIPSLTMFIGFAYSTEQAKFLDDSKRIEIVSLKLKSEIDKFNLPDGKIHFHVSVGTARDGILSKAEQINSDLIVISSRQPDITTKYLLGSTAASVVRYAKINVLVVR